MQLQKHMSTVSNVLAFRLFIPRIDQLQDESFVSFSAYDCPDWLAWSLRGRLPMMCAPCFLCFSFFDSLLESGEQAERYVIPFKEVP